MELRHLRYFVAVAEKLHFSRAAEQLNISTPTLSHQIQALETMLGAQLLSRKKKSAVTLTQTGKRFLEEARATLRQAENAELVGKRAARGDIGSIAIGYILSASCIGLLPELIGEFQKENPGVSLQLKRMETFPQMKAVIEGDLDIGFIRAPQRYPAELTGFVVDRHPYYAALPESHPLAARKQITPALLAKERFVSGPLEIDVGFWGNLGAVSKPGQSLEIVERTPDIFSLLTFVAAGVGLGVISAPMRNVTIPGVVYRKIVGAHQEAEIAVAFRKSESAPAVKSFIQRLRVKTRVRV
ncbi:MAG TPA: LysR substrate-binding domain-containing protein [Rhizomicrobium sp.]|nr:LysR substrate-binding domain-containing protein [Rhizomicrobium sp.]